MMTLKELFKKRSDLYYKELLNYSRYVFNDHFTLVLVFLIGATVMAYSSYLEELTASSQQAPLILFLLYFLVSLPRSISFHVEEADQVFLLAKEEAFYSIFKKATIKSYFQGLISVAAALTVTYPVLRITHQLTPIEVLAFFLTLASLKWIHMMLSLYPYFYQNTEIYSVYRWLALAFNFLVLGILLFFKAILVSLFVLLVAFVLAYLFLTEKIYFNHLLKWDRLIRAEDARRNRLYRLIAVFVDIPQLDSGLKRLAIFDTVLDRLSHVYPSAPYYYSLRMVVRKTEYRSLIIRLNLMASLFLLFTESYRLALIFTLFFIYILGFQLIVLVRENQELPQFKLTPVLKDDQIRSALYLIHQILILSAIIMTVPATIQLGWLGLSLLPIMLIASSVFSYYYIPYRLKIRL